MLRWCVADEALLERRSGETRDARIDGDAFAGEVRFRC